jgi:hypothetical protein
VSFFCRVRLGLVGLLLGTGAITATPFPRTVSASRQFILFGDDAHLRGSVAQAAEQTKSELLAFLQIPDRWSVPILLNLAQPQANVPEIPPLALSFSQTGAGLKIQLDLLVGPEFDPAVLRRETLRALLLEMSYRTLPSLPGGDAYNPPPDWLVDGILAVNNPTPELLDALESAAAQPPRLKTLFTLHPALVDSQSRSLYRACSGAFLRTLVAPTDGRERLRRYINDWPVASADMMEDVRSNFPALGKDEAEMEKNWRASIARIALEQRVALLGLDATSQQLDECLQQTVAHDASGKNALTLEQAGSTRRAKLEKPAARVVAQRLMLLGTQAHPLLRPIVADYQFAAEALARGHERGLTKRLAAAAALRLRVTTRMREVDDYMNWFEATQSQTSSGRFRDYIRAAETRERASPRHDPLSVYLDAMETEVQ